MYVMYTQIFLNIKYNNINYINVTDIDNIR